MIGDILIGSKAGGSSLPWYDYHVINYIYIAVFIKTINSLNNPFADVKIPECCKAKDEVCSSLNRAD